MNDSIDRQIRKQQIKSKQRVARYGEVFTAAREVNAMLDLVKSETERIESRFLEPACGEGAFLTEILRRKLAAVKDRYGYTPEDYERYAVLAITSIYGVELLPDNVEACRRKLFEIWDMEYRSHNGTHVSNACRETVKFILRKNIICGNMLTARQQHGAPIVFSEWTLVKGNEIVRRDYALDALLSGHELQMSISMTDWDYDEKTNSFTPSPVQIYPPTDYRKLALYE